MGSKTVSTSLWGRELKFPLFRRYLLGFRVDLLVRSWVEISKVPFLNFFLRVDLLVRSWVEISIIEECYDFDRSTSLWGRELKCKRWLISKRQHGSTSLWGRELKWYNDSDTITKVKVDLLVRSWGEICMHGLLALTEKKSTSLWGRELKYFWRKNRNWWSIVDLLVRSGVEISTSSKVKSYTFRRPPCEVVSWNVNAFDKSPEAFAVDLLVRSWVEIYCTWKERAHDNWSTSLWGRELKCQESCKL